MQVQDTDDVEIRAHLMPDEMFHEKIQSLNVKQREFFTHVLQWLKTRNDPRFGWIFDQGLSEPRLQSRIALCQRVEYSLRQV